MTRRPAAIPFLLLSALAGGCGRHEGHDSGLHPVSVIGEVGQSPGQFAFPRAIDTDGRCLWVIDKAGRVQRIEIATGKCLECWRMPETELGKPTGVTVFNGDPPLLFVPDTHYQRVMVYAIHPVDEKAPVERATPEPVARFGKRGKGPGEFIFPTDIAVIPTADGKKPARLYIAEYGDNDRISVYEPDGSGGYAFKTSFGHWGDGSDVNSVEFNRPQSISLDMARGELIVADAGNHRLGRLTLEGKLVRWIGSSAEVGDEPGHFHYPWAVVAMGDGTAMVVDQASARVQRIDLTTGSSLGSYGEPGPGPGQLAMPWALAITDHRMYVVDASNNRVVVADVPKPQPAPQPAVASTGGTR